MSKHSFYLFYRSKSQLLRLARTMSRQEACRLTRFLCKRYKFNVPGTCISHDKSKSVYTYVSELFEYENLAMFRRFNRIDEIKAFAKGLKISTQSKKFFRVFLFSKIFEIINFLSSMCAYFLNALIFKSSLISH